MWSKFTLLCVLITHIDAEQLGDRCVPNNKVTDGTCKLVYECQEAVRSILLTYRHPFKRCDFVEDMEVVCCPNAELEVSVSTTTETTVPSSTTTLKTTTLPVSRPNTVGDKCVPNHEVTDGTCKLVYECPEAVRAISHYYHHPFKRCDFVDMIEVVCCPPPGYRLKLPDTTTPRPVSIPTTNAAALDISDSKFGAEKPLRIADKECEKIVRTSTPPIEDHIIGGVNASVGEFPHMVALGYGTKEYQFQCGGSLISDTYIITAAHCLQASNIMPTIARIGDVNLGGKEFNEQTDIRIADVTIHPMYSRRHKYHDLALLRLEKAVRLSFNANSVCLYTSKDDPKGELIVTGWGRTNVTKDAGSPILLKAPVKLVDRRKCNESYTGWRRLPDGISDEQICAGDPKGQHDTCQGDSGGPLQGLTSTDSHYRLVGVTSFGRGCGSPVPGVYTRISHYLDWIESIVWSQWIDNTNVI